MRKILLGGLAAALLLVGAPMTSPASADPPAEINGGCYFDANMNAATNNTFVGVIGVQAVTTHGATKAPLDAVVECQLYVGSSPVSPSGYISVGAVAAGTGIEIGQQQLSFPDPGTAIVSMCEKVTYSAGHGTQGTLTYSSTNCPASTSAQVPPEVVYDTLDDLFIGTIDPLICGTLGSLAGSYGGVVTINSEGDISIVDAASLGFTKWFDCPPYDPPV